MLLCISKRRNEVENRVITVGYIVQCVFSNNKIGKYSKKSLKALHIFILNEVYISSRSVYRSDAPKSLKLKDILPLRSQPPKREQ